MIWSDGQFAISDSAGDELARFAARIGAAAPGADSVVVLPRKAARKVGGCDVLYVHPRALRRVREIATGQNDRQKAVRA